MRSRRGDGPAKIHTSLVKVEKKKPGNVQALLPPPFLW